MSNSSSNSTSSSPTSNGHVSVTAVAIIVPTSILAAFVAVLIVVMIIKYKKKKLMQSIKDSMQVVDCEVAAIRADWSASKDCRVDTSSIERFLDDILKEKPVSFTPQHIVDLTQNFAEKLGSGGFGIVYKGQLPNGVLVAVKVLKSTMEKKAEEQFMAEVGTIGRTHHINLVRLYGFCFEATVKALVYEFMENGSLDRYLFDSKQKIDWTKLHEIAVGTARGIRYLHEECQKKIVHYDIKPGNVLLSANFAPKVADFGLAKYCDRDKTHVTMTGGRGTPGYAAPELWMPFPVTCKCDVYSFGMMLFEILGRRRNLEFRRDESQEWFPRWIWNKYEEGEMEKIVSECAVDVENREKAERMCKVALWCVQYHPDDRPSMTCVVRMLEGQQEIMEPLNPFQYMAPPAVRPELWSSSTGDTTSKATSTLESGPESGVNDHENL